MRCGSDNQPQFSVNLDREISERERFYEFQYLDACLVDPSRDGNLFREDGRGLFLMCSLMDRVEQLPSRANMVRLTLHRA